jgi:hypothetical protein
MAWLYVPRHTCTTAMHHCVLYNMYGVVLIAAMTLIVRAAIQPCRTYNYACQCDGISNLSNIHRIGYSDYSIRRDVYAINATCTQSIYNHACAVASQWTQGEAYVH